MSWVSPLQTTKPSIYGSMSGFTLIEIIIFIIVTGILAATVLIPFSNSLTNTPTVLQKMIAVQTAVKCMEWFIGQRGANGYSSVTCPSTAVPSLCTAPSGYTLSVSVVCTTLGVDPSFKTLIINVNGNAEASLLSIIADY